MKIQPETSEPQPQPMASASGDLRAIRENSSATVAELKAFLRELQGKSPQEMLGVVASSQLFRAVCISTVVVLVLGLVFTAIPYALGSGKNKDTPAAAEPAGATAAEPAIAKPSSTPAATPNPNQPANSNPLAPTTPDLSKLGVTEEKKAPPNKNPLENKGEDFLKGLE